MASRTILRHTSRWFSSNSKVLAREENAVENACLKLNEQKLEKKLAREKEWEAEKLKMLACKKELDEKLWEMDAYQQEREAEVKKIIRKPVLISVGIIAIFTVQKVLEEKKRRAQDQVA